MKQLKDSVWQRRGISWIWDAEALHQVAASGEVLSLRQLMLQRSAWQDELPSNHGRSIVIAGLDACLDLLPPSEAEIWLGGALKETILSFQDFYGGSDASLVFWLPNGQRRIYVETASDAVKWRCAAPHAEKQLDFGRLVWGEATEYPQEIVLPDSAVAAGMYHARIT